MEVYILDSLYRRTAVVDRFESLIWTERWKEIGDFELLITSTPVTRSMFAANVPVALNESRRVMLVETVEDSTDPDGRKRLKVKGRSLEKLFEDRAARYSTQNTTDHPTWNIQGTPMSVVNQMFTHICVAGGLHSGDIIPLYAPGSAYPPDNIPETSGSIIWEQEPSSLLSAFKNLADIYSFGFRLYRDGDKGQLLFNTYTGSDRTSQQNLLPAVIFSPGLDTVHNTTKFMTVENAKNVAYVVNEQGFQMVYADDVDLANLPTGRNRRVLMVTPGKLMVDDGTGTQVDPTPTELSNYLIQEGKYALAEYRALLAFDGETNPRGSYKYEIDYFLGDLVEMRDEDGVGNNMRVSEQIFVSDGEGDRAYPTLMVEEFIVPGAWDSWLGNKEWDDFGATEYWNTMP